MKTINQHISELRVSLPKDYPNVDDRTLLRLINEFRGVHIKNTLNQNDSYITPEYKQRIKGIELELVDVKEVPFLSNSSAILKSKSTIPNPIALSNRDLILRVWDSKILGQEFSYVSPEVAKYSGNGKVNNKEAYCFLYDGYLYIKLRKDNPNLALINIVSIEGIFDSPEDLIPLQYNGYFDWHDYEYPIDTVSWSYIKPNILRDGLNVIQTSEQDE